MRKYRSFRDDEQIGEKLDEIPKSERSTIIRMALREYFKIVQKPKRTRTENKGVKADGCATR